MDNSDIDMYEPDHTVVPLEEAHRLYDSWEGEYLVIDGFNKDDGSISARKPGGESVLIDRAIESDRYVPVKIERIED